MIRVYRHTPILLFSSLIINTQSYKSTIMLHFRCKISYISFAKDRDTLIEQSVTCTKFIEH